MAIDSLMTWKFAVYTMLFYMLVFSGCGLSGNPDKRVILPPKPDPLESQYLDLARQLGSEKPCYLISSASVFVAPFNSPGTRASFIRSRCFHNAAQATARPELCEQVSSVNTLLYPGYHNNRERCLEDADREKVSSGVGIIDHNTMFEIVGFTKEEISDLMQKHELPKHGVYCLLFSREFFERIVELPNFGSDEDLKRAKSLEWQRHPFLNLPGFPCAGAFFN